jgi:large subunit ribosomal protein L17
MRHGVAGYKLSRSPAHRKALAKNMIRSFLLEFDRKGYIVTTRTKAKFIQPKIEKMISLGREKNLHNVRRAMSIVCDREAVAKLFDSIGPYYANRPGGYTRVLRLPSPRLGDNAPRAYLGYVRDEALAAAPVSTS